MATLVYSDVDGVDRSFALGSEPVMVGRAPGVRDPERRSARLAHARAVLLDQGTLWVEDLGSSNGIFVGPNKVQRAPVPTGEIILIGSLMIRLVPAERDPAAADGPARHARDLARCSSARTGRPSRRSATRSRSGSASCTSSSPRRASSRRCRPTRAPRAPMPRRSGCATRPTRARRRSSARSRRCRASSMRCARSIGRAGPRPRVTTGETRRG